LDWTNIDAGIAFNAARRREVGFNVAIQAALHFARRLFRGESQFHFDIHLLEAALQIDVLHLLSRGRIVIVVVTPFAQPHLLADEVHALRQALGDGNTLAVIVNGDGCLVAVFSGPNDVLRSPGCVAAEENSVVRTLHGFFIYDGHVPFVELDSDIAFDPGKSVLLADGENHVVRRKEDRSGRGGILGALVPLELFKLHPNEFSVFEDEALGRMVDDDLDAFLFGILQFPWGSLEESTRAAGHNLNGLATQTAGRAAAIHSRVADADDQNFFANRIGMAKGNRLQPIDADMNAI